MLKKMKGLFNRDKSGFTMEELEWQKKVGIGAHIKAVLISTILGIFIAIICAMGNSEIFVLTFLFYLVIATIVMVSSFLADTRGHEAKKQLEKNLKYEENQKKNKIKIKILEYIGKKEFSNIFVKNDNFIQELFHEAIKNEVIRIQKDKDEDIVYVSLGNKEYIFLPTLDNDILDYFDIINCDK